ncbi:sugar phosphate nucleotidyltransferase [Quatrionicoccus australiensis]|uniref:sugar phosphate nucleotidyltransferase n=1 Tax=Quatrionicoccus australiensis TaxID=138118 RepID=UPI001CF8E854|nr:sugar phosphate nucleotidyltransferase [Quatrionicoccus australiensis]UCV13415.1 hypothetical protein KI612_10540 [Quatrionicoccus australiensis]
MSLIPVTLCGGAGSRLWPVSRESHPKPFIRLADGQSLLQKAFLRGAHLGDVTQVLTVTNREFLFKTEDVFHEVTDGQIPASFLLEPRYIATGHPHRLENQGVVTMVLIEVQSGEYLAEDDIVSFHDYYGRG